MAKHKQKNSRVLDNHNTPQNQPYPAVSVIIPLYNAEKYIGECLDSVLAQTFQNFEVIVVDDCSTDNSVAIVESYMTKFNGRLILSHMERNSGSGSLPRNKGMNLSQGEYIFFVDNDDLITKTALEELYTLAKDYDAEVVYCEKNYEISNDGSQIQITSGPNRNIKLVDKPTLESWNMAERVQKITQWNVWVPQWRKLVKRRFIFEYEIFFPNTRHADDVIWTDALILLSKKFLRVPNAVYINRQTMGSIMRTPRTPQQSINFWLNPSLVALKSLEKFFDKANLELHHRYMILDNIVQSQFFDSFRASFNVPPFVVYDAIKKEFGKLFGEHDVLISTLCAILSTQLKIFIVNQQKFNEFAAQAQKRIAELEAQLKNK